MGIKLFLSGISVFILPGTPAQVVVALLVALGSLHVTLVHRPYVEPSDNAVAVASLWAGVVALLGVLLIHFKELYLDVVRAGCARRRHFLPLTPPVRASPNSLPALAAAPACTRTRCSTATHSTAS